MSSASHPYDAYRAGQATPTARGKRRLPRGASERLPRGASERLPRGASAAHPRGAGDAYGSRGGRLVRAALEAGAERATWLVFAALGLCGAGLALYPAVLVKFEPRQLLTATGNQ
jgi:hypothetical protein